MARKSETEEQRQARGRLKERHDIELAAHGEFIAIETKRDHLEAELAGLDVEQAVAVTKWIEVSDAVAVASVLGWSPNRVRAAGKLANGHSVGGSGVDGVDTAAVVA